MADWTINHERFSEAIAKSKLRKVRQMISKESNPLILLETHNPMTCEHPLYTASKWNRLKMVKLLCKAGAHPDNIRPKYLDTALHIAAMEGRVSIVKHLMDLGCDTTRRNFNGHTALDVAIDSCQSKVIELLKIPPATPKPPQLLDSQLTSCLVGWHPPVSKGCDILEFKLRVYGEAFHDHKVNSTTSIQPLRVYGEIPGTEVNQEVDNLQPGKTYYVTLVARNSAGWSKESDMKEIKARPTPPDKPNPPTIEKSTPTSLHLSWDAPHANGYRIDAWEIGYRIERNGFDEDRFKKEIHDTASPNTAKITPDAIDRQPNDADAVLEGSRILTPAESADQSIRDAINQAKVDLSEAHRKKKDWLAIFAPLDHELSEEKSGIDEQKVELDKLRREHEKLKRQQQEKSQKRKRKLTESLRKKAHEEKNWWEADANEEDENDPTSAALRKAEKVLHQKLADIELARNTIYNNGVLKASWKHEQELRHAEEQCKIFKENLKAWAKEQAVEQALLSTSQVR